ncbi:MAG: hypothetical protein R3A79_17405 [Nannocystaceae bacterium]
MRSTARHLALAAALALAPACGDDGDASAGDATGATEGTSGTESDGDTESTGAIDEGPWDSFDQRPCPSGSFLTYENFGGPFMNSNCTGCHHSALGAGERQSATSGVDFDTVDLIRAQADRIWARSGDQNDTMPPAGPPSVDERALLGEWLACGAPTAADLME